ncbi:glycosyl transferase family 2 [Thioclava sp. ES.031]|uniref:glycosyltransferase n=1 Tax=Thioclava sp. ES.031 TaxID=1798203 RepID=UPI000C00A92F|nr:glycosyltransferase [Thioclava sp. ES.031]PFG62078.1 glycosyl transferase family 2 [Thioclava sp. ES.031]
MTGTQQDRPLVTFALFAFNQEKYIHAAVEGALAQTYEPLEIILSDDCSTDRTFEIMQEMVANYDGPHRLVLRRNSPNLGLIEHVNLVFGIASAEYIVAAAGDDVSVPHRVEKLFSCFEEMPLLIHSDCACMDERGRSLPYGKPKTDIEDRNLLDICRSRALYLGATGAWHKDLVRMFGPITQLDTYEDLVLGYRAALAGRVAYVDEALVRYRVGTGTTSEEPEQHLRRAKAIQVRKAALGSLRQRKSDTLKHAPDRHDLLRLIERQICVESAVIQFRTDMKSFILHYSYRWPVVSYLARAATGRMMRAVSLSQR